MSPTQQAISYKDPSGFVVKRNAGYYRYVTHYYAAEYDHLMQSGLYRELVDARLLLPHQEQCLEQEDSQYYRLLFPEQVGFITHPFEWTYSQWQQAALVCIRINQTALAYGMILKDATPYNFVFYKGNCLLLDTLSFDFFVENSPWIAYRQFCEEILAPFALMHYSNPYWSRLYASTIKGMPLSFVSKQLPLQSWFSVTCLLHIHGHAVFQEKKKNSKKAAGTGFTTVKLQALLQLLQNTIANWQTPLEHRSDWENYYEKDIEEEKYLADKTVIVTNWLAELKPVINIDLGANTGKFSFIAALYSRQVYALESDEECADLIYKETTQKGLTNITTIVADITEPSPGLGWRNQEKTALLKRMKGDMVMALAVIHHLCITKNIPLSFVAKLIADLTSQYAITEFVPREDSKVQLLLQNRADIFKEYTEEKFISCFSLYFRLIAIHSCEGSGRKLFLWEKN